MRKLRVFTEIRPTSFYEDWTPCPLFVPWTPHTLANPQPSMRIEDRPHRGVLAVLAPRWITLAICCLQLLVLQESLTSKHVVHAPLFAKAEVLFACSNYGYIPEYQCPADKIGFQCLSGEILYVCENSFNQFQVSVCACACVTIVTRDLPRDDISRLIDL